ncbi:MAG: pilus assembly protein PilM [Planctomycetota bacterium]|jgi:type IV pilus assembly protein PilM
MLWFLKNRTYSIGVDIGRDNLKLVQLGEDQGNISLIAGTSENRPKNIKPGSGNWQRWAIETIRELTANGGFRGREVIAAMPASELFIDHIRMPKVDNDKLQEAICSKIKQKLPFEPDDAMIKYIPTEEDNVLVIAAERKIIDRHLAVYEKAGLTIKSIGVWPIALTNSYTSFFARRKTDVEVVATLLDIEANCTNVVICRHKKILFARSVPIGASQLDGDEVVTRLVLELTSCKRHFASMYPKAQIERLIFLSGQAVDKAICTTIAKQLEMPAQMADCLAAVKIANPYGAGRDPKKTKGRLGKPIDRRNCRVNWATAFGLSLS